MSSVGDEERAVITLQMGNYSNYIGSHFWNIQEAGFVFPSETNINYVPDINNSVLFREGATGLGQNGGQTTYTPRLVSVDLKGALGRYIQNLIKHKFGGGFSRFKRGTWNVNSKFFNSTLRYWGRAL